MRFLIAPDSFKGSCTARQAAEAIARGLKWGLPTAEVQLCPIADGGEGTVEAFAMALGGERRTTQVPAPLADGPPVEAEWLWVPEQNLAVCEMAAAAGLPLVPSDRRDPTLTSSFGVGVMLREALEQLDEGGQVYLGLGGSATVDGGSGVLQGLGFRFLDADGQEISKPMAGGMLDRVASVQPPDDLEELLAGKRIGCLVDVENPLLGSKGAAVVFGPQKGATSQQVRQLEANLTHWSDVLQRAFPERAADIKTVSGGGAAGGISAGLNAALGAEILPGASTIFEAIGIDVRLDWADVVIVGEGQFDTTSLGGKGPGDLMKRAMRRGKHAVVIAGQVAFPAGELNQLGIRRAYNLIDRARSLDDAQTRTLELLEETAQLYALYEARQQPGRSGSPT
jgi:glycerate kinase